jgi:hypothetical protein
MAGHINTIMNHGPCKNISYNMDYSVSNVQTELCFVYQTDSRVIALTRLFTGPGPYTGQLQF